MIKSIDRILLHVLSQALVWFLRPMTVIILPLCSHLLAGVLNKYSELYLLEGIFVTLCDMCDACYSFKTRVHLYIPFRCLGGPSSLSLRTVLPCDHFALNMQQKFLNDKANYHATGGNEALRDRQSFQHHGEGRAFYLFVFKAFIHLMCHYKLYLHNMYLPLN